MARVSVYWNWLDADGAKGEVGVQVGGEDAGDVDLKGKGKSVEDT